MSTSIYEELLTAIKEKAQEKSFKVTTSGGLDHFVTSESTIPEGLYIGTIPYNNTDFKVYMV